MSLVTSPRKFLGHSLTSLRMMSDSSKLRVNAVYGIYKGKCAMTVKVIPPNFEALPSGRSRVVSRNGVLFFEFAPFGSQPREYDWTRKATFSLGVTELGEIVRLKETATVEFMHDPNAGSKIDCVGFFC